MLEPRRPVSKFMPVAWIIGGPLNLIIGVVLFLFFGKGGPFYGEGAVFEVTVLCVSCSFGMALAVYRLKEGAATRLKIFLTVFTSAFVTTAIGVIILFAWMLASTTSSSGSHDIVEGIAPLIAVAPSIFLVVFLLCALPAAIYGAVVLMLVGYRFKARP